MRCKENSTRKVKNIHLLVFLIQGKQEFEDIPQRVETETAATRQVIQAEMENFIETVEDSLQQIDRLTSDVSPVFSCVYFPS